MFLDLTDVAVLVVGAGPIGARKAEALHAAGARVRVVATTVGGALDRRSTATTCGSDRSGTTISTASGW